MTLERLVTSATSLLTPPRVAGLSADEALAELAALGEAWHGAASRRSGESAGIRYQADDAILYGVMDVDEADFGPGPFALQHATEDAYRRLFSLLDSLGYPHLWRAWNYLADINVETNGLERYRQFNIGRHDAFVASHRLARGNVPAACALGTSDGPLSIAFLAGRVAPVPLENPRQISAYNYPATYGPRSPTFSRAVLVHPPGRELLLISGTASIVGHQTMHVGDVEGQTRETLANIEALLGSASERSLTTPYRLSELHLRAYIRHPADLVAVRAIVDELAAPAVPVIYVRADVCRADLLVEIEAIASHPMGHS
jgi:enamine deaminase RidA (YjgF/YER057c/UK114 family)